MGWKDLKLKQRRKETKFLNCIVNGILVSEETSPYTPRRFLLLIVKLRTSVITVSIPSYLLGRYWVLFLMHIFEKRVLLRIKLIKWKLVSTVNHCSCKLNSSSPGRFCTRTRFWTDILKQQTTLVNFGKSNLVHFYLVMAVIWKFVLLLQINSVIFVF